MSRTPLREDAQGNAVVTPRTVYPGTNLTKLKSGRRAQVSSVNGTYAYLYWVDQLRHQPEMTKVSIDRILHRPDEWRIDP